MTSVLQLLGLAPATVEPTKANAPLSREFRYRPTRDSYELRDREGRIKLVRRDVRSSNDWEAYYAALWSSSLKAVADEAGVSFSKVAYGLRQYGPMDVRRFW